MDSFLLTTKFQIPRQSHHEVRRSRLIDALEHGILNYKLILVSAAAGYGKTTLLSQWAHTSRFPVVWLSISPEDNDLKRFLRYLFTGWEKIQPGVCGSSLGLLLGTTSPDSEAVLSAFINIANERPDQAIFVLDDYHLIEDPTIHTALAFLLDHLPPTLHFVLIGRGEPPLSLARYRAHDEMLEFGAEELHFWPEETQAFLNEMMGLDLDHHEVVRLHAQLEGWIAGLQLVALTLQRRLTGADKLVVSGRHRFIADYLNEDVLAPLSDKVRHFLLQTSLLDRLCGSLCEAVTARKDGQEMLETLEQDNLFLVPLDDSREWFRYHRLFADFLQEELNRRHADQIPDLHRRAAQWYLARDLPEQAFRHAVDGHDVDLVNQVFERYFVVKLLGGEVRVVGQWLDSLPKEWQLGQPMISFARAGTLLVTGQFEACARFLDEVEQSLGPAECLDMRQQWARLTALRCFIACSQNDLAQAEILADQALRDLPEEDLSFRPTIFGALGDTYRRNGYWQAAKETYLKALAFGHAPIFQLRSAHMYGALADLDLRQGRLRNAAGYWREALVAIQKQENWGRLLPLPVTGWMYIRLGELLYEWNELAEAWDHLLRGLEYAELGGDVRAMIAGYLFAGRLKLTEGNIEKAAEYLERARPHVEGAQFSDWLSRFERFQLELWLAQDRLRAAIIWVEEMLQADVLERRPESEVAQLAIARVLIIKGDVASIERALARLERLLQTADEEGRTGVQIEGLGLQALALWRQGERVGAMTSLERALRLAEPEGYMRLFADYGLPMVRLLQEARSRAVMPDYVDKLLAACGADLTFLAPSAQTLPEPLTSREQEILGLLAAGLTNREIAAKLGISPGTVKKHVGSIYGKLSVHSRTGAVARARELDLLD
jgi:LuxR family transcriptional regulator, maltose regulon positive regulatory protein